MTNLLIILPCNLYVYIPSAPRRFPNERLRLGVQAFAIVYNTRIMVELVHGRNEPMTFVPNPCVKW